MNEWTGDVPPVLGGGGTWQRAGVTIDWSFELDDGWDLDGVAEVLLVPFRGDQAVVALNSGRHVVVRSTVEPGEHWCVSATRALAEEAGLRVFGSPPDDRSVLHPFGVFRCHSHAVESPRSPRHYLGVVAWCEVERAREQVDTALMMNIDEACQRLDANAAALYRLAAMLRGRGLDDATLTRDTVRLLEEHYLRAPTPWAQSGKSGDAAAWELGRRVVLRPIRRDGTFLDIGCANGFLMESVHRWAAEDGRHLEPYGLDYSERLVALARARLPQWHDRFFVGDALSWVAPRRFDFVHTMPDMVPMRRRPAWLARVLREMVAPGGRLIVRNGPGTGRRLGEWGLPVSGVAVQNRGDRPPEEAVWLDAT